MGERVPLQPPTEDALKHKASSTGTPKQRFFDDATQFYEEEIREALMKESKKHRLWRDKAIKSMRFDQLEHSSCIHYVLESFTESRSTSDSSEAYTLGQYLEKGFDEKTSSFVSSANPWDFEVLPAQLFVEQTRVLEFPGSSKIGVCNSCNADGSTHCFHCRGNGTDKCGFCRGTGMRSGVAHPAVYTHPMVATFPHADLDRGYASSGTAMVRHGSSTYGVGTPMHFFNRTGIPPPGLGKHDLCYTCHGRGVKECHHCKGQGKKVCATCRGSGSVRTFTKLIVYFETDQSEFFTECDIPLHLISKAHGKEIFSETAPYVFPITKYPLKSVNEQSRLLCVKHYEKCAGRCRVIQQRQTLTAIPIVKVSYSLGSSHGVFWVYGDQRLCYIPKFPAKCNIM